MTEFLNLVTLNYEIASLSAVDNRQFKTYRGEIFGFEISLRQQINFFPNKIMALTKVQKQKIIADLEDKINRSKSLVFANIQGLKVKDLSELRKKIKEGGGLLQVVKKTLLNLIFKKSDSGLNVKNLNGEVALIFSFQDEIKAAKTVYEFSKEKENLKIISGIFDRKYLEKEKVLEIAQLPAKEELLGKLVFSIKSPISNLVNVLQGNIKGLITVLAKAKT